MQKIFNIITENSRNTQVSYPVSPCLATLRDYRFLTADSVNEIFGRLLYKCDKSACSLQAITTSFPIKKQLIKKRERRRKSIEYEQGVLLRTKGETAEILRPLRKVLSSVLKRGSFCDVVLQREGDEGT